LEKDEADKQYLERFEVYKQSTIDFKPDLFLCDLLNNEACFDIAWKFKIPAVGVSSSLSSKYFLSSLFFFFFLKKKKTCNYFSKQKWLYFRTNICTIQIRSNLRMSLKHGERIIYREI
jgi:hypothetical protein